MKKLKVVATQSNYIVVEQMSLDTTRKGVIIAPNTKGKQTLCKVITTGDLKVFPEVKAGSLVMVGSLLLTEAEPLDRVYDFQEMGKVYKVLQEYAIDFVVEEIEVPDDEEVSIKKYTEDQFREEFKHKSIEWIEETLDLYRMSGRIIDVDVVIPSLDNMPKDNGNITGVPN